MNDEDDDVAIGARELIGLGGFLVGAVVAGLVIGWLVDDVAGTSPVGIIVGLFIGVVAAVVGSCVRIASYLRR